MPEYIIRLEDEVFKFTQTYDVLGCDTGAISGGSAWGQGSDH